MTIPYRHLGVPYRSQWGTPALNAAIVAGELDPCDDPAWRASGFMSQDAYRFWARRICGLACLESILDFLAIPHGTRCEMLGEALRAGVYVRKGEREDEVKGLIYRPFSTWVRGRFQVHLSIYENLPLARVASNITSNWMAIASVSPEIRRPETANPRRGGHLVLIHGADANRIWFHNPSGVPPYQADACLPIEQAERFHAARGMFVALPTRTPD